jgi:hypothetical protein
VNEVVVVVSVLRNQCMCSTVQQSAKVTLSWRTRVSMLPPAAQRSSANSWVAHGLPLRLL